MIDIAILKTTLSEDTIYLGNLNLKFTSLQTLNDVDEDKLIWIKPGIANADTVVNTTKSNGIICNATTFEFFKGDHDNKLFIISDNPKLNYFLLLKYIEAHQTKLSTHKIHPTAIINEQCILGKNVEVGAYSIIGAATIQDNCIIGDFVKIFDNVSIGNNCKIREHCSIGGAGFGYYKNEQSVSEQIPHIGNVIIENNVDIFPFSNVDRGTIGATVIGTGTKIDHYVHIGHNCIVGQNNVIAAGTILAGGAEIEENCFVGVNTMLKEKTRIGANVITGMGSVVLKNIPPNEVWVGNPAKKIIKK
jgi:UDP-3-O-[3-hydroxymyristoyl] glucosamine N-acyltransferase